MYGKKYTRRLRAFLGPDYWRYSIYNQEKMKEAIMSRNNSNADERKIQKLRALMCYANDFAVIPVKKDKTPLLKSWVELQDRKATPAEIERWWADNPDANIAIVLHEGYVVLDVDDPHIAQILLERGIHNETRVETSVSGGLHIWFRESTWVTKTKENLRSAYGVKADILTKGAYLIVPPSDGYTLLSDKPILEVVDARVKSFELLGISGTPVSKESIPPRGIPIGARNETLAQYAGSLCKKFKDYPIFLEKLDEFNQKTCQPPLERKEIEIIARSIYGREQKKSGFDSNTLETAPVFERKYFSLKALLEIEQTKIDWIWDGYLAKGFTTLLSGLPKVGKTTLLFELIKAFQAKTGFLSRNINFDGGILIITEENRMIYQDRLVKAGISPEGLYVLPASEVWGWSRDKILAQAHGAIQYDKVGLVIFDTLGEFWGVGQENDASQVIDALKPIKVIASQHNVALLLVHHLRKGEGEHGKAHRGSNAILGAVDIGLELNYPNVKVSQRREIVSHSRFSETPPAMLIEYVSGVYKSLGAPSVVGKDEVKTRFLNALSEETYEPLEDISKRMDPEPGKSLLSKVARECRNNKSVDYCGEGTKGKAWQYRKVLPSK